MTFIKNHWPKALIFVAGAAAGIALVATLGIPRVGRIKTMP